MRVGVIPGVGEGRKRQLLRQFGSLKGVRAATIEQLSDSLGPVLAERVHGALHGARESRSDEVRDASIEDASTEAPEEGP